MNLLDTASLVVTPNGYKASKLYSIVPSDGTGDMTFARTGDTATRVNSSGLIETVLANKPRLDYLGSTCPKLLLEPQRTNVILQSQDISSASWSKANSPTIGTNVSVSPDGTTTSDSIQSADGTNYKYISQTFSVSANSTYTLSTFIKKETTRTNYGGFSFYFAGGTAKLVYVAFNEVSGIATNLTDSTLTPVIKVDDYGTYWRCNVTATDTGSNTSLIAYYYATISSNGTSVGAAAGSARTIWGMQLEAGAYATSYIPTTTASVTRNEDTCSKTSATALIGQTEGTIFVDFFVPNSNTEVLVISKLSPLNLVRFRFLSGIFYGQTYVNGGAFNLNSSVSAGAIGSRAKLAIGYKSGSVAFYYNGILIASSSGTFSNLALDTIEIAAGLGTPNVSNNNYNSIIIWKTRLQNSELATLTSL
jgi:hypothetical protein